MSRVEDLMSTRDLSFKTVVNPAPKVLSPAQVAAYNERGYLKPFRIFDAEDARCNRAYFDGLLKQLKEFNDGRDTYAINGYHECCEGIYDLVMNPRVLDMVEDLMGPNIVCWGTHYFCKTPHDPKSVPWHQDASYWPFTPARTVTVWLAIDDASIENACMCVLPGTHRLGHLSWKDTKAPAVLNQQIEDIEKYGQPAPIELKAGEIELHADMLAHGSPPNPSPLRRCGLTMRYCPPEVRPLKKEWGHCAILCRGTDRTGHWRHIERPIGNDLTPHHQRRRIAIGAN